MADALSAYSRVLPPQADTSPASSAPFSAWSSALPHDVLVTVNAVPHDTRADCAVALRDGPLTVGVVWRSDAQAVTVMVGEEPPGNADGDSRVPRLQVKQLKKKPGVSHPPDFQ